MLTLVLGTSNAKKRLEMERLLAPLSVTLRTLSECPGAIDVVEDGETFADNAFKKASQQSQALGAWVIAEDSGLVVTALGGAPGVFSARFAGEPCDDARNNSLLLERLAETPTAHRTAYYQCCIAVTNPTGELRAASDGRCYGRITAELRGTGGFGYDPLFELAEYSKTFGELSAEAKRCLSHRARAMRALLPQLASALAAYSVCPILSRFVSR